MVLSQRSGCAFLIVSAILAVTPVGGFDQLTPKQLPEIILDAEAMHERQLFLGAQVEQPRQCDHFGYAVSCIRRAITKDEASFMLAQVKQRAFRAVAGLTNKRKYVLSFLRDRLTDSREAVLITGKFPAFIPFAAYGGSPAPAK
jgi:hypothetical protein